MKIQVQEADVSKGLLHLSYIAGLGARRWSGAEGCGSQGGRLGEGLS